MRFQCPSCKRRNKVSDRMAGKKAKRPGCGTVVRLPDRQSPTGSRQSNGASPNHESDDDRSMARSSQDHNARSRWWQGALLLLVALAIIYLLSPGIAVLGLIILGLVVFFGCGARAIEQHDATVGQALFAGLVSAVLASQPALRLMSTATTRSSRKTSICFFRKGKCDPTRTWTSATAVSETPRGLP